jgi:hypothetical protein
MQTIFIQNLLSKGGHMKNWHRTVSILFLSVLFVFTFIPQQFSAQDKQGKVTAVQLQKARLEFKSLIQANPNYFGTLLDKKLADKYKPVLLLSGNVSYEELKCVGLHPENDILEAVIEVKRPFGFGNGLCYEGTTEYVAFFIDYQDGAGFQSVGDPVSVNVHNISTIVEADAASHLYYAVRQSFVPKKLLACSDPQVVQVRAILSWLTLPTSPDYSQVWGNTLNQYVQIRPKFPFAVILAPDSLEKYFLPNVKLPPEVATEVPPKPLPPEKYMVYGNLHEIKSWASAQEQAEKVEPDSRVEPERLNQADLLQRNPNYFGSISPSKDKKQLLLAVEKLPKKLASNWKAQLAVNPDILNAISAMLLQTKYEQVVCAGLYPEEDLMEAVIEIKLPYGFCGDLCHAGSKEYVVFYVDWGDGAGYVHAATSSVRVHDIPDVAAGKHLFYAVRAKIPGIDSRLKTCGQENIVKLKAVLCWAFDPTPYGPEYAPPWGNSIVRNIQIRPTDGLSVAAKITEVSGVPDFHINSEGYALKAGTMSYPYEYDRPFGGIVACNGKVQVSGAVFYRFLYSTDGTQWFPIVDDRYTPNPISLWIPYLTRTPDSLGWFDIDTYINIDLKNYTESHLVYWRTNGKEGKYFLKLEVGNASKTPIGEDVISVQLDNTAPAMYSFSGTDPILPQTGVAVKDASNAFMKCQTFLGPAEIRIFGNFWDKHFNALSLYVFGGNIQYSSANIFNGSYDNPPPSAAWDSEGIVGATNNGPGQKLYTLNLCTIAQVPQKVKCAYGIRLYVTDRTIYGYLVNGYEFRKTNLGAEAYVTFDWDPTGCN